MSKYLDKDGLAHLWERIQELVATCGGSSDSGSGGISKTVSIPSASTSLRVNAKEFRSSLHLTIGGSNSKTGTLSFEIVGGKPANYHFALVEDMYATSNFHLFEKMQGYMVRETSTSIFIDLFFYSEEEVTIVGSDIYIRGLVFSDILLPISDICYIEGTCSSGGGGGEIA